MNRKAENDGVQVAFKILENVYSQYNNDKINQSNQHHLGHPDRVEHDLSEREKEHLVLLRAKLYMEISEKFNETIIESSESNAKLGKKVFWLNIVMAILTLVLATSAALELYQ